MVTKTEKNEIDLMQLWRIMLKRRWVVVTCTFLVLTVVAILTFTATPIYQATATVLIENQRPAGMSLQDLFSDYSYYSSDYQGLYFHTQLELLRSRSLGERVAKRLNLANRPELLKRIAPPRSVLSSIKRFITLAWLRPSKPSAAPKGAPAESADVMAGRNALLAAQIIGGIRVNVVEKTGLVRVSYESSEPALAAEVVNALAEEFYDFSVETRYEATQQASEFLSEQIAQLREDLAVKERELQKYGQEKNLLFLSDEEDTVVGKLRDLYNSHTAALINKVKKEAALRELQELNVDALSTSQQVNSPTVNALLQGYLQTKNEYQEKLKLYTESYPEMQRLKGRMDSQRSELKNEIRNAIAAAESDYRAAVKEETSLKGLLDAQAQDAQLTNSNKILYNALKIEVDNMRTLLAFLVSKQNETLVTARVQGQRTSNIRIIDKALVPQRPIRPNVRKNLIMALLMGLFFGLVLAFGVEFIDTSIKSPEDVERLSGLPSLGVIPSFSVDGAKHPYLDYSYGAKDRPPKTEEGGAIELINHHYPNWAVSEAYRTIRTSILFSHADREAFKSLTFTSVFPQEGKSTTSANVAVSFAQMGEKVLLLDGDLRKPRVHRIFKLRNLQGLSTLLTGRGQLKDAVQKTFVDNLFVITSGPIPPNPAELLNSGRMRQLLDSLKETFSIVIIDSPPLIFVSDAAILSSLSDSVVIVLRPEKAQRRPFMNSIADIQKAKANIIGVVFNDVDYKKTIYSYDRYRYYYRDKYHYKEAQEDSRFQDR